MGRVILIVTITWLYFPVNLLFKKVLEMKFLFASAHSSLFLCHYLLYDIKHFILLLFFAFYVNLIVGRKLAIVGTSVSNDSGSGYCFDTNISTSLCVG